MHMAFLGQESQWAAEASECAADQNAFWTYHDKLFTSQSGENQGAFNKDKLKGFAAGLGLDTAAFNACLDAGKYTQLVQSETNAAQQLGVQSTPSFYVNDFLLLGALPLEQFEAYFTKVKQGIHPAPTPTPLPAGVTFYDADPSRPGMTYDGSPTLGDAKGSFMMLAFADFKSADSAKYATTVWPALRDKYVTTGKMRVVFKVFPSDAPKAAAAAACAANQGKFWEFADTLFAKQAEWKEGDDAAMTGYAKSLGLNEAKFTQCLSDPATQSAVDAALKFGQDVGVPSVPAFLFLDLKQGQAVGNLVGAKSLAEFETAIEAALGGQSAAPTSRPTPISAAKLASLPVGVDADGNFYRGDPKAPIRLVDFSDCQ